jgi:uncharacterized protein YdeI (YjbR/CyaY-like superfamily)
MPKPGAKSRVPSKVEPQLFTAKSAKEWGRWLGKNCAKQEGVWLRMYKKGSGKKTVTYAEALDEALCHGWIDGIRKSYDEVSFLQRFTPRRKRSVWSKINTQHVERLTKSGKMKTGGLDAVAMAKQDGRWAAAYDSAKTAAVPEDFLKELSGYAGAGEFFKSLNRTNVYSIVWRLQTATRSETRARRMKSICEKLARGEKFHP